MDIRTVLVKTAVRRADGQIVGGTSKRLKVRRPGTCAACGRGVAVGEQATWEPATRRLTCLGCTSVPPPAIEGGQPGASALREYERRHNKREQHARETLGGLGVLLARVVDEPQSTRAWKQGAQGEVRTAERLAAHLRDHGVRLLHDCRVPGHGHANIDHIAIGPAGVLVIDTKTHRGDIRVDRIGGLFAPRRTVLLINGRDQTKLLDGVERQIGWVRRALHGCPYESSIEIRGALCFPNPDGLPLFSQLTVRDIVIDGPKPIARLARGPGPLTAEGIEQIWNHLRLALPAA